MRHAISIEVVQTGDGRYKADVESEDGTIGAFARAGTAELAAIDALKRYGGILPIPEPQVQPHPAPRVSVQRFHLPDTIRAVLQQRCDADDPGLIELAYTDADDKFTVRIVRPVRIGDGGGTRTFRGREYLLAIDVTKDEPRHFALDNIEWIEVSS